MEYTDVTLKCLSMAHIKPSVFVLNTSIFDIFNFIIYLCLLFDNTFIAY